MKQNQKNRKIILTILLIALSIFMLVPFYWMVISSLKMNKDVFSIPMKWLPDMANIQWNNYQIIWKKIPLLTFFLNTAKLAVRIPCARLDIQDQIQAVQFLLTDLSPHPT